MSEKPVSTSAEDMRGEKVGGGGGLHGGGAMEELASTSAEDMRDERGG